MTKMKGLIKGLRYISHIFESGDQKERELEIGFPTDVKHVAHIGLDGPSATSPSWMDEFKSAPELSTAPRSKETKKSSRTKLPSEESLVRDLPEVPKPSRRHQTSTGATSLPFDQNNNATQEGGQAIPKQSRRQSLSGNTPSKELSLDDNSTTKPPRRSSQGSMVESSSNDSSGALPKQSRKKKSKGASSSGEGLRREGSRREGSRREGSKRGGSGGGSVRSRVKNHTSSATFNETYLDPETRSLSVMKDSEPSPYSTSKELHFEEKQGDHR